MTRHKKISRFQFPFCCLLLGLIAAAYGCEGRASDSMKAIVESDLRCSECEIVLDTVATLHGAFLRGPGSLVARDSDGRTYVVDGNDGVVKQYGTTGQFVREIGRRGGGPGEYEGIRNLLTGRGDSLFILDASLARLSVFGENGEFLGATPAAVGAGVDAAMLADGRLIVNTQQPIVLGDSMYSVQVIARNGSVLPFGAASAFDPQSPWTKVRHLVGLNDGGVVVAHPYSFRLDLYGPGQVSPTVVRLAAEWAPTSPLRSAPSDGLLGQPYTPQIAALWEDANGRLWLEMDVPASDWKPGPSSYEALNQLSESERTAVLTRPRLETIIEVVDLDKREVIARSKFRGALGAPVGGGYWATSQESSVGEPSLRLTRFRLTE